MEIFENLDQEDFRFFFFTEIDAFKKFERNRDFKRYSTKFEIFENFG